MGFLLPSELLNRERLPLLSATLALTVALASSCGSADGVGGSSSSEPSASPGATPDDGLGALPGDRAAAAEADTFLSPVPNGQPMPASEAAAGIVPYPTATVWVRSPIPRNVWRIEAFTPDPWQRVVEFYEASLGDWTVTKARDMVIFEKEPDLASVTVSPWDYQDLPPDAPPVLKEARTAIGAAWR